MWPFRRREARGRHALGAAVTGIPTMPMRPPPVTQVAETVPALSVPAVPAVPAVPDAVAVPVQAVSMTARPTAPAVPDAVVVPVPVAPLPAPPVFMAPVATPLPSAAPTLPSLPVQPVDLEPALLELADWGSAEQPVQPTAPALVPAAIAPAADVEKPLSVTAMSVQTPGPVGPRVELGFTDGSFRRLDPGSSAAQELSDLVTQLTHRA